MRYLLLILAVVCPGFALAESFTMTTTHCQQLKTHVFQAVAAKAYGKTYSDYVRDKLDEYRDAGEERNLLREVLPYSLETAWEYYHNPFDEQTPYEEMAYQHCLVNVGVRAQ